MPRHRASSSPLAALALVALLVIPSACATFAPARHEATSIAASDRQARLAVAREDAIDPGKIPARTVGVLPFVVAERDTLLQPLGYGMSSFLLSDLAASGELRLVERERVDAIMRELDLVDAGATDPRTGPRVGRLLGVRRLVIGTIAAAPGNQIVLGARVVDVLSGTVQNVTAGTTSLDRIFDAQKTLAFSVFEQLGVTLTPAQRAAIEQKQTTNLAATIAFGRGLRAEARGDAAAAARAFEDAARIDGAFTAARTEANRAQERVVAAAPGSGANAAKVNAVARVLDFTAQSINVPVATKLPEAADAPFQSFLVTLILTLRIF